METAFVPLLRFAPTALGNFLSGMETLFFGAARVGFGSLGNFLSGMETGFPVFGEDRGISLGNFLSGMETRVELWPAGELRPLETSLVEWKPQGPPFRGPADGPWKLP